MRAATALMLLLVASAAAAGKGKGKAPAAPATTPAAVLREIPALPKAAKKDLDCSAKESTEARIQQALAESSDADSPPPDSPSLSEPEFYSCVADLQQRPPELWIDAQREKLDAKLAAIDDAKAKTADTAANTKRFNAQAVAAATQFLKDAQPVYADYVKEIAACIARREALAASGTQQDWDLVAVAAGAQGAVCNAARDAAGRYLEPPP